MRYYLAATLIPALFLTAIGKVIAQSPEPQQSVDTKLMAQSQPEVLCERTEFGDNFLFPGSPAIAFNREVIPDDGKKAQPESKYGLSSVTVPAGGWKVDAIAIYTNPGQPAEWRKVGRARLNVIAKKGDLPGEADEPRKGREVEVTVREAKKGVYEVCAAELKLTLEPGEYWIGLTPIHSQANGFAEHLIAFAVRDARFDDVHRAAGEDLSPEERAWSALSPTRPGEHLSIRIEGRHIRRGQILDWPADKISDAKQLHLRYGAFDPLADPPKIPKELMEPDGNLWIVQCRQVVDQSVRDQLTQAGATLLRDVPDDAYIVRLKPETVETIRKLESVRWIGPYHPAYRLDPSVVPDPFERNGSNLSMRSQLMEPEGWRYVLVYLFDRDEVAKKQVRQVIENAGGKVVFQSPRGFYLAANLPQDQLAVVARCDAVCAIERRYGAFELAASGKSGDSLPPLAKGLITLSQIRELCGAEAVKQAGGYEGLGVRVAFWDDGIRDDHVDLLARPVTVIGPKYWARYRPRDSDRQHSLRRRARRSARRGLLPLGGLVFATDQVDPVHEDRYGLVERFVKDHRAVVLSSSSSNWGGGGYIKHYDGYSFLLDDLVLESDLLICTGDRQSSRHGRPLWLVVQECTARRRRGRARQPASGRPSLRPLTRVARPRMGALSQTSSTSGVTCIAPTRLPRAAMAPSAGRAARRRWWPVTAA